MNQEVGSFLSEKPHKIGLRKGNSLQVLLNRISMLNEHTGFESVLKWLWGALGLPDPLTPSIQEIVKKIPLSAS